MVYVAVAFSDSAAATKTGVSQRNYFTHFEWCFCVDWSTAWSFSCALGTLTREKACLKKLNTD